MIANGNCCMTHGAQTCALLQPRGVGCSGTLEGGSRGRRYMYTYGWFMLMYSQKPTHYFEAIILQLEINLKKSFIIKNNAKYVTGWRENRRSRYYRINHQTKNTGKSVFQGLGEGNNHFRMVSWKCLRRDGIDFTNIYFFNIVLVLPYINMNPPWYTRVPHPEPSSHLLPQTIPLSHPSAPAPSILYHASNLDWRLVSYMLL